MDGPISYAIKLSGRKRPNGSIYIFSERLPGFHYIMAPGENPQQALLSALNNFLSLSALLKNRAPALRLTPEKNNKSDEFTAELEFA